MIGKMREKIIYAILGILLLILTSCGEDSSEGLDINESESSYEVNDEEDEFDGAAYVLNKAISRISFK